MHGPEGVAMSEAFALLLQDVCAWALSLYIRHGSYQEDEQRMGIMRSAASGMTI